MFQTLALAVVGAVLAADTVSAHAFLGCYSSLLDRTYVGTTRDAVACADLAGSRGYKVSHFKSCFRQCYGSNYGAAKNTYRQGYPTSCPITSYTSYATNTPYKWVQCPGAVSWDLREGKSIEGKKFDSGADCLRTCASVKSRYAVTMPGLMGVPSIPPTLRCFCARYVPVTKAATCQTNGFFMYDAGPQWDVIPGPEPSGTYKRRTEVAARLAQEEFLTANPECPADTQACYVSENPADGFECLDTTQELTSCGGCRYGAYDPNAPGADSTGVDCLFIPGVNPLAVSCVAGQCQVGACAEGYVAVDDQCVPA